MAGGDTTDQGAEGCQRLDKWLWYARFFKTRSLAARMVTDGKVRLAVGDARPERVTKAAQTVRVGDVLTFPQGAGVRVVRVRAPGTRRGPAAEAQALYEDVVSPTGAGETAGDPSAAGGAQGSAAQAPESGPARDPGAGRPTKRERRAIDAFKRGNLP